MTYSPDKRLIAARSADHTVRLWRADDPDQPPVPFSGSLAGSTDAVYSVAFSPNGRILAAGSADRSVWLWDVGDPERPGPRGLPLLGAASTIYSVAFSPDGRVLAAGGADRTGPDRPTVGNRRPTEHPSPARRSRSHRLGAVGGLQP
ncbi:WD40 repeat domain-containing protein [Plantactinospora sp. WMMC1484]|uniref:WD40 repeat domain-containing protein n=1 Tax=Plantactinospora sp. WMMC1484 TaxID=3404122 RepID=UPI003BF511B1